MDCEVKLAASTFRLSLDRPYLAAALWSLQRVSTRGLGTLAVDQFWRLYYDPEEIERYDLVTLSGILYHELCHLIRDHGARRPPDADPRKWNIAADAEINDDLRDEKVKLPRDVVYPETIKQKPGRLAEEYYKELPGNQGKRVALLFPRCGSCATGVTEEWEHPEAFKDAGELNPHGGGQLHNGSGLSGNIPPPISSAEGSVIRELVAHAIAESSQGSVPGHWKRWAEERLTPQVDWRRELASAVRSFLAEVQGASDYSYRRPSRRQTMGGDIVFPSLCNPTPRVAVVVDTSASINDEMLSLGLTEISGILRAIGQKRGVHVLAVDGAVQSSRRVFRASQVQLLGGGGTDMRVGLQAALVERPRPEVIVVITDGFTPWPERPCRGARVIIVLIGSEGKAPGWARCVTIPSIEKRL